MASKRIWMARDCGYTADPKTQALGDEFGADGPLVVEEVFALAKLSEEHERLVIHYGVVARRAFTTPAKARKIIDAAIGLGMLDLVERFGPKGLVVGVPRYLRWQIKDPTNAARQQRHRNAKVTADAVTSDRYVTPSNGGTVDSQQGTEVKGSTLAVDGRALAVIEGGAASVDPVPSASRRIG